MTLSEIERAQKEWMEKGTIPADYYYALVGGSFSTLDPPISTLMSLSGLREPIFKTPEEVDSFVASGRR